MSQEPTAFELCLPVIVAGLILETVVLATGEAVFPHVFQEIFLRQAFEALTVAVGLASGLGVISVFFYSRGEEEKPRQDIPSNKSKQKTSFPPGGTDAL